MLQWKYITANSCSPPGYSEYFSNKPFLPSSYWTPGLSECIPPYPNSGQRSSVWPEIFFNCAEVKILPSAPVVPTPHGRSYPANKSEFVRVNQVGYLRFATKVGVIVDSSTSPIGWQIQNHSGSVVLSGVTTVYGDDAASGDHVHKADFTALNELGAYRLVAEGIGSSFEFNIATSLYPDLPHEAMNYFYFHRMGEDILAEHLIDGRYARTALHPGDSSVPPYNGWCVSCANFDLKGSWADAGDFGIYTVNHAISAWTLLNLNEMFPEAFQDGSLNIPESGNGFADVLDEVDYGSRFVRGMLPSDGGLASHKAHNHAWSAFSITIEGENAAQNSRSAMGPSTPATYAVARVNGQLARMWYAQGHDSHADVLWSAAVDAWNRAYGTNQVYSASVASPGSAVGGGDYSDGQIGDDLYAAACEMYLTALAIGDSGMQTYKDAMRGSIFFTKIDQWDWATVTGAGTLSLFAVANDLTSEDKIAIETNIVSFANSIKDSIDSEGYPSNLDFQKFGGNYPWGSNSFIMNRAIALAYAYEITGDVSYQDYILRTLDYVMGVNAMHISYVTGYGTKAETDTHDRWAWTIGQDAFWPRGWLSGGPNNELINDYETPGGVAAAKSYAGPGTAPHAWGSKENTVNWNAPLAWVAWYVENKVVPNFGGCDGNCVPLAQSQSVKVQMDTPITLTLSASDYDGSVASWEVVSMPQLGTLSGIEPNLMYTPNPGATGSDFFTFRVYDNSGDVSTEASILLQIRDCNLIDVFGVPSAFNALVNAFNYVHVSEDGPNLAELRSPGHRIQWNNPGLYQFSLELNSGPYYVDLTRCMTGSESFTGPNAGFALNGCGVSGLDGEYWIAQYEGSEVWVEKNNLYAIVFSNDPEPPEFCISTSVPITPTTKPTQSGVSPTTKPTIIVPPPTSSPTNAPTNSPTNISTPKPTPNPTSNLSASPSAKPTTKPTLMPSTKPTVKPTTKPTSKPTTKPTRKPSSKPTTSPTSKPVTTGGSPCCADRNVGYQSCMTSDWCNMSSTNCGNCNGYYITVPLEITGCCKWWSGGDCSNVVHSSNPGCHYRKSDCEGSCGGTWSPL